VNASAPTDDSVLVTRQGRIGLLVLNRPKALNALDLPMIRNLTVALDAWAEDPSVHAVVITGAGDRAFCAGGDIRAVRDAALSGDEAKIRAFFGEEYALNAKIAAYPKPYISLIDGFCMGGGIGLSVHGAIRVASEKTQFAMPETAIALFPDVGATHVLPRLPGELGMYLGLTGVRVTGADAVHAGFATHFVHKEDFPALTEALGNEGVTALVEFARELPPFSFAPHRATIDRIFGLGSIDEIEQALRDEGTDWAAETLATLAKMSPSSLRWTFDILRAGAGRTLKQCLEAEFNLVLRVTRHPDFAEGVRAMVIDKDRNPKWQAVA
jgi:enoyl-CoA hydratase/carnithine racemase